MTIKWGYEPVCPSVTHFEVKASLGPFTVANATTDLTNTSYTFEDLALDTVYKTCVSAFDKDENLMATSCSTSCGTYPESEFLSIRFFFPLTHLPLPYGLSLQVCDTSF